MDVSLFQIYCNGKKITRSVSDSLEWSSDEDTLGVQLSFSFAQTDFSKKFPFNPGDIVIVTKGKVKIFTGIIVDISIDGTKPRQITCLDFAFYLNKSETTIQFKKYPADAALKKLLSKYPKIKLQISKIPISITKIYKAKTFSEIIEDILETVFNQTGQKYVFEMDNDTLVIRKKTDLVVKVDTKHIINPRRKLSIQEMKNKIDVVLSGEKSFKVLASSSDPKNIKKYGLLTKVHEIEKEEVSKAKNIANKLLQELDKVVEETEIDFLGNTLARAGRLIKIKEPITGISGIYSIKNAHHVVSNGSYLMTLKLEKVR